MDDDTIAVWESEIAMWETEHARAAEARARRFRKAAKVHKNLTPEDRKHLLRAAYLVIVQAKVRARRAKKAWAELTRQRGG